MCFCKSGSRHERSGRQEAKTVVPTSTGARFPLSLGLADRPPGGAGVRFLMKKYEGAYRAETGDRGEGE